MTIVMSQKNQITIPKKIASVLHLKKGSMFSVALNKNRIELIPVDVVEKTFTKEEYKKLDLLVAKEKGEEKRVTSSFLNSLKKA